MATDIRNNSSLQRSENNNATLWALLALLAIALLAYAAYAAYYSNDAYDSGVYSNRTTVGNTTNRTTGE